MLVPYTQTHAHVVGLIQMEEGLDLGSKFSLLCEEDDSCLHEFEPTRSTSIPSSEDEYIRMLIERESTNFESKACSSNISGMIDCSDEEEGSGKWFKCARLDAINWVLNTREILGFHFRTAYLSLAYFDRFSSRRLIEKGKVWAIPLLSIACLSLAAKMEEQKVPALSQYHLEDYSFESSVIRRMELLVLNTLDWRMCSITPFSFLHHFIPKFHGQSTHEDLVSKAIELILGLTKDVNVMDHRPSVIAAAAVLAAYDGQLTRKALECKLSVISSWGSAEKECIFSCYNQLRGIENKKNSTPELLVSPNVLTNHWSSANAIEKSMTNISAVGSKRKLIYSEIDPHCPLLKITRDI